MTGIIYAEAPRAQFGDVVAAPAGDVTTIARRRLAGDSARAVQFLADLFGTGRVALASMPPDGTMHGRTFTLPNESEPARQWIDERQGQQNIYFTLNEPCPADAQTGVNGVLRKDDVATLRGVAIDLDPDRDIEIQPGGFERERQRLLKTAETLKGNLFGGPTAIVDSGGGVQALWIFNTPIPTTAEQRDTVEAIGRSLGKVHGSDAVHSAQHVFRLPFTVNLPDAKKRQRGRKVALARCLHLDPAERHSLDDLRRMASHLESDDDDVAPSARATIDRNAVFAVLGAPDELEPELVARLASARERDPTLNRLLAKDAAAVLDRSGHDFSIAAAVIEGGIVDPTDIASIVAAYSPSKTEQRGEAYIAGTVAKALGATKPRMNVLDWFDHHAAQTAQTPVGAPTIRHIDLAAWRSSRFVQEPPEQRWLVKGTIPLAVPVLVGAAGDIGKSYLFLDLGMRVAFGSAAGSPPIFGGHVASRGTSVLITAEDSAASLHRRIANLDPEGRRLTELGDKLIVVPLPDAGGALPIVLARRDGFTLSDDYRRLRDQLERIPDLAMVAFDPLQAFVQAAINESPEAGQYLSTELTSLAAVTDATVLVAHHMGKVRIKSPDDARDAIRGTSALVDGVRLAYALWPEPDDSSARAVCRSLGTNYVHRKVVRGAVVKANGEANKDVSTYVRNSFGLLVDRSVTVGPVVNDDVLRFALVETIAEAAAAGMPMTRTGDNGIYKQRNRMPPGLKELSRERIERIAEAALQTGQIVQCAAKGSAGVKFLDIPDGPFAEGRGHFAKGAPGKPFRPASGSREPRKPRKAKPL